MSDIDVPVITINPDPPKQGQPLEISYTGGAGHHPQHRVDTERPEPEKGEDRAGRLGDDHRAGQRHFHHDHRPDDQWGAGEDRPR